MDTLTRSSIAISCFTRNDVKNIFRIAFSLDDEAASLLTYILSKDATKKIILNNLIDAYQMENPQSKLNIETNLDNLKFREINDIQDHLMYLRIKFVDFAM